MTLLWAILILLAVGCSSKPTIRTHHDWAHGEHWCEIAYANGHVDYYSWRQGESCEDLVLR